MIKNWAMIVSDDMQYCAVDGGHATSSQLPLQVSGWASCLHFMSVCVSLTSPLKFEENFLCDMVHRVGTPSFNLTIVFILSHTVTPSFFVISQYNTLQITKWYFIISATI